MNAVIGAALGAAALVLAGAVTINPAAAAPQTQTAGTSDATGFSAHRHQRRHHRHHGDRPYDRADYRSYYYGRPTYYRPYPYDAPAPFTFGIGFGPFWW